MDLESRTSLEMDMRLMRRFEDVAKIIHKIRERNLNFSRKGFDGFLNKVNNIFRGYEKIDSELFIDYHLTAACIYVFADPLLELMISQERKDFYSRLISKKSDTDNPLDLFFRKAHSDEKIEEEFEEKYLEDFIGIGRGIVQANSFGTDECVSKIENELRILSADLENEKKYTEQKHFMFVGLQDVCLPLLKRYHRGKEVERVYDYLIRKYGEFYLKLPNFDGE